MVIDFWSIVGSNPIDSADGVRSALDRARDRLDGLEPIDLVRFTELLQEYLYRLDRRELAEVPVVLGGGLEFPQTSDHFLYARCACILAGKDAYDRSLRSSEDFARYVKPSAQAAEGLLYLASTVYEEKVGSEMQVVSSYPVESMSNEQGWGR